MMNLDWDLKYFNGPDLYAQMVSLLPKIVASFLNGM